MRRPVFIARQSSHPRGLLGRALLAIMRRETAADNDGALDLLALKAGEALLDVGFGPARTLERIARRGQLSLTAGVDVSVTAADAARRRLSDLIALGRVEIHQADSCRLPFPDARFDAVQSVHTLYFWDDPIAQLIEIRRVMRPGARLCLGFRPAELADFAAAFPDEVYRFYESARVLELLRAAGFDRLEAHSGDGQGPPMAYALAHQPATVG